MTGCRSRATAANGPSGIPCPSAYVVRSSTLWALKPIVAGRQALPPSPDTGSDAEHGRSGRRTNTHTRKAPAARLRTKAAYSRVQGASAFMAAST